MPKSTEKPVLTRKHLARQERERIQTQYIMIGVGVVAALLILLIGYGIINELVLKPNAPVATIDGQSIPLREFQIRARYSRQQIVNQYIQTFQFSQMFGSDASTQDYFNSQLAQISYQLEPTLLGQSVVDSLVEDRIIRAEAKARGITVTADEVERALQEAFQYYANGTPTPEPTYPAQPTSTLSPAQLALVPPTPTQVITPTAVPTQTATPTVVPTLAPTTTPLPTSTPFTEDAFKKEFDQTMSDLKTNIQVSEADLRDIYESMLYRQKVMDAVTADTPHQTEQVWARHILVADKATADSVKARLDNGEDFATLAKELSTDTASAQQGGDLGWFGKGKMVEAFETVAFSMPIGQISDPVESSFGFHIIQVLGHEERPLDSSAYDSLRQENFQKWLEEKRNAAKIDINGSWISNVPLVPTIPPEIAPAQ